ncbi:MAG TPA: metallophosphoesterase [Candidatus Paceibacterota bacterium]
MKTTLVLPDIQYPYHDKLALSKLISVAKDFQPDAILQIGDGIDFPTVSRWAKDTALEYAPTLQKHIDGFKEVLSELRDTVPKAKITWLEGNHDLRLKEFIKSYAPALGSLRALEMENLFGLSELDIEYRKGPIHIGTNTYAVHGHEASGYCNSASAWDVKFAKRYGSDKNFLFGHTHQPFIIHRAFGYEGKVSPRFTMNVGSIMDPVAASYVKDGAVSWVMSFALLRDDGKRVYPELITMVDRGFYFSGKKY